MKRDLTRYILKNFDSALEHNYIQVYYQPVIRALSGRLCSFEALARWIDPIHGVIRPDEFIPLLEEQRWIHRLDCFMVREACRQFRACANRGESPVPISFNLSRLDFMLCDVFQIVDECASTFQVPHECLCVEITESVAAEQGGLLREVIDRFHAAGYQVWMDDFGSGYSSLNMLKDYPFDELKLDMRFLSSFDQRSRRILTSVIQMAKEIGIHTLAEGVETAEQAEYLRDIGCEKLQGFYFGKPLPYAEAMETLKKKGIGVEKPRDRQYYEELGMLNFLSPIPFATQEERDRMVSGLELNSLPLALVELRRDSAAFLFRNCAFEEGVMRTGIVTQFSPLGTPIPPQRVPASILAVLETTRVNGTGQMQFVSNEEYYELQCKRVAKTRGACSILVQLNNLSQAAKSVETERLDDRLRQLYALYDRITIVDLANDCITPLFTNSPAEPAGSRTGLTRLAQEYAENWIYEEDKATYLTFFTPDIEKRIEKAEGRVLSCLLRTKTRHGRYAWKLYSAMLAEPGIVIELVRDVQQAMTSLNDRQRPQEPSALSPELLWRNLINSDIVRLFWKDTDRRFLGVSKAFLDYYGFASEQELIGKNDEDLGWHIHPDDYMDVELSVIHDGVSTHNIPGRCIRGGENREILASKAPLLSENGQVLGLIGCFIDRELLIVNDARGADTRRRDPLTGLLDERGIAEEANAFRDEYYRRETDFVRLHLGIDDIASLNRQYGYDFGDKLVAELGRRIKRALGASSAVGRVNGYEFVVLHQIHNRDEMAGIRGTVRRICSELREIDGSSITLFFSIGYALFSEFENLEEQSQKAALRLLADHDEHTSTENRLSRSAEIFRLYDDLPIAYAVYKVQSDKKNRVRDATLFYVNHLFEKRAGKEARELLGRSVRELFPTLGEDWYDKAGRAALHGETMTENMYYEATGLHYYTTVSQVIRPGYCCFTYQEIETIDNPDEDVKPLWE